MAHLSRATLVLCPVVLLLVLPGFTFGQRENPIKDPNPIRLTKVDILRDPDLTNPELEGALLKWRFQEGKSFYQKHTTETKQTMKIQNNDVNQAQKQTFYLQWTPEKKAGDTWVLKLKIEGVAMDIDIGNQKISYDSTNAQNAGANPLGEFFQALVGSEFKVSLDTRTMELIKIEGREEFLKKLIAANPQMKPLLENILPDKALLEMADPIYSAIPGRRVTNSEKWKCTSTLDMGPIGKYINTYHYTYVGKDGQWNRIKVQPSLQFKDADGADLGGGLPFNIKDAKVEISNARGTILFDPEKGRIKSSDVQLTLKGTFNINIGGQATEIKLTQDQATRSEISDSSFIKKP